MGMIRVIDFRKLAAAFVALLALSPLAPAVAQKNVTVLANYTFHGRHAPFFVAPGKRLFRRGGLQGGHPAGHR
jgi:ABC-type nitrate/sulfonate/bicarbonate transport system substrate-binding protein